ncbi:hypothetical protein IG631_11177 [Alternaria alternata]|nr:hypothetical protein IG631_11177 [Alternaria alternata]
MSKPHRTRPTVCSTRRNQYWPAGTTDTLQPPSLMFSLNGGKSREAVANSISLST